MATENIEDIVELLENEFDILLTKMSGKQIIYDGITKNGDTIVFYFA